MKTRTEDSFLKWAKSKGLSLDPAYPDAAVLGFEGCDGDSRFWEVPREPERRPHFIATLLGLPGDWSSCFCWRHLGSWPAAPDQFRINDRIEHQILKGIGLPLGTTLVAEFGSDEIDGLCALVFSTTIFGWSVGEDLYLVPDHGRHIFQTDHHGVIHVSARTSEEIARFADRMSAQGFHLPDEPPDPTFKMPKWMPER